MAKKSAKSAKKQPKQKGKKAWRKADVEDVEEALEDDRLVARLKSQAIKGPGKKDKIEDETDGLFTIDTVGSSEGLSNASKREIARAKLFPKKGPNIGMSASEEMKVEKAERLLGSSRPSGSKKRKAEDDCLFDLWSAPTRAEQIKAAKADPVTGAFRIRKEGKPVPQYTPKTMHQKVSNAPAVIPAHEGQSMNPEAEAFEDLACTVAARQLEAEAEVEAMKRRMRPITAELESHLGVDAVKDMDEETKIKTYQSMVTGIDPSVQREGESTEAYERRLKKQKQKSQAQRNKERKAKVINAKQAQLKAQQKLEKSVGEVGTILKEMKQQEAMHAERRRYKQQLRSQRTLTENSGGEVSSARRIGRLKFREEDVAVPDSTSLGSGLRSMPLKASAVKDRITSIMRRGLLPAIPDAANKEVKRNLPKGQRFRKKLKFMSPLLKDNLLLSKKR
eukprot:TRINITY_DN3415_c0_g1_i1.p1 TRINITY_DN3415_c0_g1~~TRINITY_DN3415_c0_g1_i1.p1  ORF type:complete len:469 (+),score=126.80 TRINITY_DN3415_c0_g1_i1:62-1408(+)